MKKPPIGSIIQQGNHAYRVTEHPITSTPEHKIRVIGLHGKPKGKTFSITWDGWTYFRHLDEHFAVCHDCNELMPCSGMKAQREVEKTVKAMQIPDGFCPSCSEPITSRQEKQHYPGPNLLNPLAPDGVTFHLRQKCRSGAESYEKKWLQADPGRKPTRLTLECSGLVTVHADGTGECDNQECPHIYARHRGMQACTYKAGGCTKGCDKTRKHGIWLRKHLNPDGTANGLL